jgi:hypothetical protein
MGEDPGTASTGVTDSNNPEEIRREIEVTREEMGDTVAALAAKADVKAQAKRRIEATKTAVSDKTGELMGKAKESSPETASRATTSLVVRARQNPIPTAAAGAFAFGFLAGRVLRR